jgi:hypothetical protein
MNLRIIHVPAAVLDRTFLPGKRFKIRALLMPAPPFGVRKIANLRERSNPVCIIDGDYLTTCFARLADLFFCKARAAADERDGFAFPALFDLAKAVDGPPWAVAEYFFSAGSMGFVSVGPMAGCSEGALTKVAAPASISWRARVGVTQMIEPPQPSAIMQFRLIRSWLVGVSIEPLEKPGPKAGDSIAVKINPRW